MPEKGSSLATWVAEPRLQRRPARLPKAVDDATASGHPGATTLTLTLSLTLSLTRCDDRQLIFLPEGSPPPQPLPAGAIEAVFPNVPYEEAKTGA